ncbi:MAG: hypothetical protein SGBAC_003531 [Bacillariaceae sp.]
MNAASIAMAVNLFHDNDKPPAAKSSRSREMILAAKSKTPSDGDHQLENALPEDSTTSPTTVHLSDDTPEYFIDDDVSLEEGIDENVNSNSNRTGLIMYSSATAAKKAPFWKRRLGLTPNMAQAHGHKLKSLFVRGPVRRKATVGLSKHEGAALNSREWDRKNEEYVIGNNEDQVKDKE